MPSRVDREGSPAGLLSGAGRSGLADMDGGPVGGRPVEGSEDSGGAPGAPSRRLTERVQEWPARFGEWWRELGQAMLEPDAAVPANFVKRMRQAIAVLLILGLGGFLIDGANRPADPHLMPGAGSAPAAARTATLSVLSAEAHTTQACVLQAVTTQEQEKGLMGVRTLGRYAGMAFVFSRLTTQAFYMKDTPIPLSIAWFGADGRFISSTDMPVCPPTASVCPTYGAGAPYQLALEVPQGRLAALGVGPGAYAQLGASC